MSGDRAAVTPPRPLTTAEVQVIQAILAEAGEVGAELLGQVERAQVVKEWGQSGSPSFDLAVSEDSAAAPVADGVLPVDAFAYDSDGEYLGEVIIWIAGGKLAALEYAWITDASPRALPPVEQLRISGR
jgi:hypothetical protein